MTPTNIALGLASSADGKKRTFQLLNRADATPGYHKVHLVTKQKDLVVQTREGYCAGRSFAFLATLVLPLPTTLPLAR
jgi:hypothetical protein